MNNRFPETNISKTQATIYEKIHKVQLGKGKGKSEAVLPYDRKEIRNLMKKHRARVKQKQDSARQQDLAVEAH